MHVELDGFRLLLVLEMVVSQEVVELIHHWRSRVCPFWKAGYLARERASLGKEESGMQVLTVNGQLTSSDPQQVVLSRQEAVLEGKSRHPHHPMLPEAHLS